MKAKKAVDNLEISIEIGSRLKSILNEKGIKQDWFAEKLGKTQGYLSVLLGGSRPTSNIETYWKIAEAIPISRKEFDQIVEDAKRKVLGDYGTKEVNEDPYFSLAEKEKLSTGQLEKVKSFIQFVKTQE